VPIHHQWCGFQVDTSIDEELSIAEFKASVVIPGFIEFCVKYSFMAISAYSPPMVWVPLYLWWNVLFKLVNQSVTIVAGCCCFFLSPVSFVLRFDKNDWVSECSAKWAIFRCIRVRTSNTSILMKWWGPICCFSGKPAKLRSKSKDGLIRNQDNIAACCDMSTCELLSPWTSTIQV
jgi:hypothetical protein